MKQKFVPGITLPKDLDGPALWFAFIGNEMLIYEDSDAVIPTLSDLTELGLEVVRQQYLGQLDGLACFSAELAPQTAIPSGMTRLELRPLLMRLDSSLGALVGRAIQVVDWDRDHQFCSRCGNRPQMVPFERAKECPVCGLRTYPRLSPAIIVRVRRDDHILLARAPRFPPKMYSVLAGFVEPGETLEEAVAREVEEEVGLLVGNIRYFSSQPWPFPNSLMLGFTADYVAGDIRLEEEEIADARWFRYDDLPHLPPHISIARRLIDDFVAGFA